MSYITYISDIVVEHANQALFLKLFKRYTYLASVFHYTINKCFPQINKYTQTLIRHIFPIK